MLRGVSKDGLVSLNGSDLQYAHAYVNPSNRNEVAIVLDNDVGTAFLYTDHHSVRVSYGNSAERCVSYMVEPLGEEVGSPFMSSYCPSKSPQDPILINN
ncbi:hypothetical protein [Sporisorium scitamineum]|uniref:Uncharacterized protein n=1 Tax=Sporisorium scitamineum TaxID=49012 RepID=A0A0F7S2S9_9BASI|nr:hypothetical protein [Sporisorium scitamineum]